MTAVEVVPSWENFGRTVPEKVKLTVESSGDGGQTYEEVHKPGDLVAFHWEPPPATGESKIVPGKIRISTVKRADAMAVESPSATLVHELAHYIDNEGFLSGHGGYMASLHAAFSAFPPEKQAAMREKIIEAGDQADPGFVPFLRDEPSPLTDWWLAAQKTKAVETLGSANMTEYGTNKYLLKPVEVFARSFAQWVALRSKDGEMLRWLSSWQNVPLKQEKIVKRYDGTERRYEVDTPNYLRFRQWQADDFEPVAAELDKLFARLGWLRGQS